MPGIAIAVRAFDASRDLAWAEALLDRDFGGRLVARRGELVDVLVLDGLVAERDGGRVGVLTYRPDGDACELAFLAATVRREGVGSALVDALFARLPAATRVWLVTTAENRSAIAFYEAKGFRTVAVRAGAVDDARRTLKPTIPLADETGEPIRDEVDMEARVPDPTSAVPPEALGVLRAFLDAGTRQDEAAMRACLSKSTLESGSFNPSAAPQGLAFEVGEAKREGAVVVAEVEGREEGSTAGTPPALRLPCVLVEEDGAWKVDLKASMDRMFGGSVEKALDEMVGSMAEAMKGVGEALAAGLSQAFAAGDSPEGGDPAPIPKTWEDAPLEPAPEEVLPAADLARLPVTEAALTGAVGSDVLAFAAIDELLAGAGSDDRDVLVGWFESALFAGWAAMLADVSTRIPVSGRLRALRIEATSMPRDRMLALDGNDLVYRMHLPTDDGFFQDDDVRARLAGVLAGLPDSIDPDLAGKRLLPRDDETPDVALYRDRVAPRLMRRISERTGRPLALEVAWSSLDDWPDAPRLLWWWGLQRVLGGVSLAAADGPGRDTGTGLDRIRLVLDTERTEGSARFENGSLTLSISPYGGDRAGPYEHEVASALRREAPEPE